MANGNGGDPFDLYGLGKMLEEVINSYQRNSSLVDNDAAIDALEKISALVKDVGNVTKEEFKEIMKSYLAPLLKAAFGTGTELTNYLKTFETEVLKKMDSQIMSAELIANTIVGMESHGYITSKNYIETGKGNKVFNIEKDTPLSNKFKELFGSLDSTVKTMTEKIMAFFGQDRATRKRRERQFIEDLVEGLARNKFVGGAISDTFRLLTYFAATWVKNIPLIGKPLAAILVAIGSLGDKIASLLIGALVGSFLPALGRLLFSGLGRVLLPILGSAFGGKLLQGTLGKVLMTALGGKAVAKSAGTMGTFVMNGKTFFTSTESLTGALGKGRVASVATKAVSAVTGAVSRVGAGIGLTKVLGVLGKIGPWLGRIFGVVSKFLGPIGLIITGLQLAWALFKNWDKVMGTIKRGWDSLTSGSFWSNLWEGIKDWWNGGKDKPSGGSGGSPFTIESYTSPQGAKRTRFYPTGVATPVETDVFGKLKLDQGGVPINLQELSPSVASKQMEAYRAKNKDLFDMYYEIVPQSHANVSGSFTNDLKMRDSDSKNREGAVLFKGASETLDTLRDNLVAAGMSREKANALRYTSGISTLTSVHSKTGDHSNPLGYGFDLGASGNWSRADWEFALPLVQDYFKSIGFKANYEAKVGGKGKFTLPSVSMNNAHFHVGASAKQDPLFVRNMPWNRYVGASGIVEEAMIEEAQKVQAAKPSIAVTTPLAEESKEGTEITENKEANDVYSQSGFTRIVQPGEGEEVKSTIVQKPKPPKIDYSGDEMFSEVFYRAIRVATWDPVQQ